jgi:hypothetical protein
MRILARIPRTGHGLKRQNPKGVGRRYRGPQIEKRVLTGRLLKLSKGYIAMKKKESPLLGKQNQQPSYWLVALVTKPCGGG